MKRRLVEHIVYATTQRRGLVLTITGVLCALSVLGSVYLLESDMTFKGMIGQGAPPVRAYDQIIRDFKVSGVITVSLEPPAQVEQRIGELRRDIDARVFEGLDQSARDGLPKILHESAEQQMTTLGDREHLLCLMDLFRLLTPARQEAVLAPSTRLNQADRNMIKDVARRPVDPADRALYRKFQKLDRQDLARLAAETKGLPPAARQTLGRAVLGRMSVFDKTDLLQQSASLPMPELRRLQAEVESIDEKISAELAEFKERALGFAGALKLKLASAEPVGDKAVAPRDVVRGVLYSEELSFSSDQLMVLLMVSPVKDIDQMTNARQFSGLLDTVLGQMKSKHPHLRVRRTGFAAVQMDARRAMFEDFGIMMGVTIIGILLVGFVGLRSLDFPLLTMLPLGVGIVVMFGIYSLFGQLNLVSMMTPIILFGLGIDYAIHLGARYGEVRLELGPEAAPAQVLRGTFTSVGPGMLVAAITTVFAFLSLLACTISGLLQSGLMAAAGVVSSFLAMVYLMPMLIVWREGRSSKKSTLFLRSRKLDSLGRLADSRAGTLIALAMLALALSAAYFIPTIRLERDGMKLSPDGLESITLSKDLEAKFAFTDAQAYFVLQGYDTLKRFRRELAREEGGRKVYPAINTLRVLDARKAIRTFEKVGWDRDINTLSTYVDKFGKRANLLGESNEHIARVYEFIARNYVHWDRDTYLVIVPPSGYVWDRDLTELFSDDLARLEKKFGVTSAGFVQIWKFLVDHLLDDLITSSAAAFVLVLLVLGVITRSVAGTLICSAALVISLLATLAIIGLLGLKLNCINIIAFPVIIGLGIDYIVHIYYRLVHEESLDVVSTVASTGKAVLLTTMTTLVAFGAISFSAHKGLSMMGVFAFIGLSVAFVCSLFLVPMMVKLVFHKQLGS